MSKSRAAHFLNIFQKQPYVLKKHEILSEAATQTKKICSEAAAQFFTVAAQNIHTLREDFHNLSKLRKTSLIVIKHGALHIPRLMFLFHRSVQASYHRLYSRLS